MNFLTKNMRTFFRTTIKTVALGQSEGANLDFGKCIPNTDLLFLNTKPIANHWCYFFKRCFLLKNWDPHFAKKKIITLQFKLFYNIVE